MKEHGKCDICEKFPPTPPKPVASLPVACEFGVVLIMQGEQQEQPKEQNETELETLTDQPPQQEQQLSTDDPLTADPLVTSSAGVCDI